MSTLVFTRRACLEGRRDKSTSIELCASMVAKLECHLINTQGPVTDPLTEELLRILLLDETGVNLEPSFGLGGPYEVQDGFVSYRAAGPPNSLLTSLNRRCSIGFHLDAPGG